MITIYHNPRCRKSRETLQILEECNSNITIVKYLEHPPTYDELKKIINILDILPIDLVRKNESIWKENFKSKHLTNDQLIEVMVNHPKLIERPIIINGTKAIIGRPPERVKEIL
ncbi:arsenate reductase (glutaredoxin) [Aquimarina sp. U1-2]|uniref:arsenate reductase (glutaredoxin) n=1 Tax=Aquimarina sp. U1-2 TaxID=2823141 RepID=UPI001AECFC11|nr:arsenate reductase (glutaredoxin) [Aquimarina sp. U1-2]MBP2832750.1 arsenate reductase (glutaredoxin) [Aquimarina sp. U1-2]